jgi:hypothetical protein
MTLRTLHNSCESIYIYDTVQNRNSLFVLRYSVYYMINGLLQITQLGVSQ